jgi:G3E family GTPase
VIETSGSATPAPIVWEIRKNPRLITDGVITVIDAINFKGYVNKSYALKIQARYTDLILINKHEDMDERTLEDNLDDLYDINLDTPKIKTDHGFVHSEIVFGLNTTLFDTNESVLNAEQNFAHDHHSIEVDLLEINPDTVFDAKKIEIDLQKFPKNNFYRIKGLIHTTDGYMVINHAFGNTQLHIIDTPRNSDARVVFMGDDLTSYKKLIADIFTVSEDDIHTTRKEDHH